MQIKPFYIAIFSIIFGCTNAYASQHYYPPERINCMLTDSKHLFCAGFNRGYLVEDTTNADFNGKSQVFNFTSAVAYFGSNLEEASIFFTFHNYDQKMVKLKTVRNTFRPDTYNGIWKKVSEDVYICNAGYMNCQIETA